MKSLYLIIIINIIFLTPINIFPMYNWQVIQINDETAIAQLTGSTQELKLDNSKSLIYDQELIKAVIAQNLTETERLISLGADVNQIIGDVRDPKYQSCDPEVIKLRRQDSLLMRAIINNRPDIVQALIAAGANVNYIKEGGYTALYMASQRGFKEIVITLIRANANINILNDVDHSSIAAALDARHMEIVKLLIEAGADVSIGSPLYFAVKHSELEIVKYLIERGANVNEKNAVDGYTPLMSAVHVESFDILKLLIESGADVNETGCDGCSPIYFAILKNNIKIFQVLIDAGVDINLINASIDCMVTKKRVAMFKILMDSKIPFDKNKALLSAVSFSEDEIVQLFMSIERVNETRNKLIQAVNSLKLEDVNRLKNFINILLGSGHTCLHRAVNSNNYQQAALLLAFGAKCNIKNVRLVTVKETCAAKNKKVYAELIAFSKMAKYKLYKAFQENNIKRMQIILNIMPALAFTARYGDREETIFHKAIDLTNIEAMKLILSICPHVISVTDKHGVSPMHLALNKQHSLKVLLEIAYLEHIEQDHDMPIDDVSLLQDSFWAQSKKRDKPEIFPNDNVDSSKRKQV